MQIVGIGAEGHIGFNVATSSFASRTRIKTFSLSTHDVNARFLHSLDDVPTHCMTLDLGLILAARELVLVAQGSAGLRLADYYRYTHANELAWQRVRCGRSRPRWAG